MKTLAVFFFLAVCSFNGIAQNTERLQANDSARIESERSTLLKELVALRDSINQSLNVFSRSIKKVSPKKHKQMKSASQDLGHYRDRLKLDIRQVEQTSKNAWTPATIKQVKDDAADIRKEHKRILALYENP